MKENNDIFLADGDVMVYLAEPLHKKYSATFVWVHPFSAYVSYDLFLNSLPLYASVHILDDSPPLPTSIPPVVYALNGWPISQPKKQIRTFECRIHAVFAKKKW